MMKRQTQAETQAVPGRDVVDEDAYAPLDDLTKRLDYAATVLRGFDERLGRLDRRQSELEQRWREYRARLDDALASIEERL